MDYIDYILPKKNVTLIYCRHDFFDCNLIINIDSLGLIIDKP